MDGYRFFRRERQGRQRGRWHCLQWMHWTAWSSVGNDTVESLWVRIKGQANKRDVFVGVYCRPPSQENNADELFFKELRDTSRSATLVLMGDFNLPDINWEYHTANKNGSRRPR